MLFNFLNGSFKIKSLLTSGFVEEFNNKLLFAIVLASLVRCKISFNFKRRFSRSFSAVFKISKEIEKLCFESSTTIF